MIDLHTHTTCSDGQYTPEELVQKAVACGITALAITDHDTTLGVKRAEQAAKAANIQLFSGIEISVQGNEQLHILGYGVDGEHAVIQAYIERNKQLRLERKDRMIAYLKDKGIAITLEDVKRINKGKTSGRPHFARALMEMGYVSNVEEAFTRYLGTAEFHQKIERPKPTLEEGISMIQTAGGVAVLAHPALLRMKETDFLILLEKLIAAGLKGIETYYSKHTVEQTKWYCDVAERYHLFCTCGSDFHGEVIKPKIALGTGIENNLCLPKEVEMQILKNICLY